MNGLAMNGYPAASLVRLSDSTVSKWISRDERRRFCTEGWMVIRGVVPAALTSAAARAIAAAVGADLADPATWYGGVPQNDGIVPRHHAQELWDIRQCPPLYEVFAEFWGTPRLVVDVNRCIFRPPVHAAHPAISHSTIHWDTDPRAPGPGSLQGVVLLTDVAENEGGYQCIPEVYRLLDTWLSQPARRDGFDFFNPRLENWKTHQVAGKAGDVILWSTKLPHGSAANHSTRPRVAAFVTMQPPARAAQLPAPPYSTTDSLTACWQTKRAPTAWRGLPGQLDPEPGPPAKLTELGKKLIGALPW